MRYIKSDFIKIYKSKTIQVLLLVLLLVMILDPISVLIVNSSQGDFLEEYGKNYFQFWILINSVSWGNTVYYSLLWVFPTLSTGLMMFEEQSSSIKAFLVIRNGWKNYFFSKNLTVFVSTFINFFVLFTANIVTTYLCFNSKIKTEQYQFIVPKDGTFAFELYKISPICMVYLYVIMNALLIAFLATIIVNIHVIGRIKNRYVALLAPIVVMYVFQYIISWGLVNNMNYDISIILQPMAASALVSLITWKEVCINFGVIAALVLISMIIGYKKGQEIL